MKLIRFNVGEYKSIRDSGVIEVGDVTCLVGKNEAGKTSLLEALCKLNPVNKAESEFSVIHDYPRSDVKDYEQAIESKKRQHATVINATFALEPDDIAPVTKEFGLGVFDKVEVTMQKGYSNSGTFTLHINESAIVHHLVEKAGLPKKLGDDLRKAVSLAALAESCHKNSADMKQKHDSAVAAAQAVADPKQKAEELSRAEKLKEPKELQELRTLLSGIEKQGIRKYIWDKHLVFREPRFLYFDEYFQMTGEVNVEKLKERVNAKQLQNSDLPMLGLIELARLDIDRLLTPKDTEDLINKLEGASNHLSKQLLKYWSQNKHLQMKFDLRQANAGDPEGMKSGTNLWACVYDSIHQATTRLGRRSRGFVWFFSFLAYFSQQKKTTQRLILLLDEPGLFLHGTAQRDLLRYIEEELKPDHQVIYTTHSPFMVDSERFDRVRIVEDKSLEEGQVLSPDKAGVKVTSDVLQVSEGALFPLQHALGYDIAQTLFIGPCTLIVEGVSDLLAIQSMSKLLESLGRTGLSEEWVITPVGGADKIATFVALIGAQKGTTLAILVDIQRKDVQKIENLYKSKLLKKQNIFTFAEFCGSSEADIEDMFEVDFYLNLVNKEFKQELPALISRSGLGTHSRILKNLSEFFASNLLAAGAMFNHYRPARFLAENIGTLKSQLSDSTLERFETVFKRVNLLLPEK